MKGPSDGKNGTGRSPNKKKGIALKRLGPSSVHFCLRLLLFLRRVKRTARLRRGGQADSISPPEMDGGRREAGESGVKKEDRPQERGEAPFLNRWKYDDDL